MKATIVPCNNVAIIFLKRNTTVSGLYRTWTIRTLVRGTTSPYTYIRIVNRYITFTHCHIRVRRRKKPTQQNKA